MNLVRTQLISIYPCEVLVGAIDMKWLRFAEQIISQGMSLLPNIWRTVSNGRKKKKSWCVSQEIKVLILTPPLNVLEQFIFLYVSVFHWNRRGKCSFLHSWIHLFKSYFLRIYYRSGPTIGSGTERQTKAMWRLLSKNLCPD